MMSFGLTSLILFLIPVTLSSRYSPTQYEEYLISKTIGYRLPNNTIPKLYTINLEPHVDDEEFTFDGTSSIVFEIIDPTQSITVHSSQFLQIDKTYTEIIDDEDTILKPISQRWNPTLEFYNLRFQDTLNVGIYTVKFKWKGRNNYNYRGYYRTVNMNTDNDEIELMAVTHFQTTLARGAFPCWDEPGFKAKFEISLKHYANYTALSNMPVKKITSAEEGKVWTSFHKSPKMSTYLVTFIITPYTRHVNSYGNVTFWTPSDHFDDAKLPFEMSQKIVTAMEEYTGIRYSLPKMDQISIPQYSSAATEHWGLISYSKGILFNPDKDTIVNKDQSILLTAHEISHNWFGNLVTPAWWSDAWLSEAFAVYFSYKITDKILENWHAMELFTAGVINLISFPAETFASRPLPIRWVPETPIEVREIFSPVTYRKGAGILHMMEHILSEKVFQNGLRKYLNKHQFGSVITDDLWQALQEAHTEGKIPPHMNIKEIMNPWIEQTGYPLLNVTRNYRTGFVTVTQMNALDSESKNLWMIPINYATRSHSDFSSTRTTHWMRRTNESLTIYGVNKEDWIILNIQNTGFYRVNYDHDNWKRLAEYLNSDNYYKIHVLNRGQLIHDILFLADVEHDYYEIAVDLISYLHRETNYLPWIALYKEIETFTEYFVSTPVYRVFEKWMLHLLSNIIDHIGFDNHHDHDHLTALTRVHLMHWACFFGHKGCRSSATRKFIEKLTHGDEYVIHPQDEDWIYCTGLMDSNETIWNIMINAHFANPQENPGYRYLGCTKNYDITKKYLKLIPTENATFFADELRDAFHSIYTGPSGGIDFALDYLNSHFDAIKQYFREKESSEGDELTRYIVYDIVEVIKTWHHFEKFTKFLNEQLEQKEMDEFGNRAIQIARETMAKSEKAVEIFSSLIEKKPYLANFINYPDDSKK